MFTVAFQPRPFCDFCSVFNLEARNSRRDTSLELGKRYAFRERRGKVEIVPEEMFCTFSNNVEESKVKKGKHVPVCRAHQ